MYTEPIKIAEKIKIERIFSLYEQELTYKFNFSGEVHNFWECVYVKKGTVCVSADHRVYNLNEGAIVFHKPLELHKFFVDCSVGAKLYIFSFMASGELCEKISNLVCYTNSYQKQIINLMYSYLNGDYKKLPTVEIIENNIIRNYINVIKNPITAQMVSTYISQLILSVPENRSHSLPSTNYDTQIFSKAVETMNDNLSTSVSVSQLAASLNISESTLKRIFKKYSDVSIHRYFLILKIQKATQLLKEGLSVCEVSERLGFSSQAYFSVCFKRETGKSPSNI